MRRRIVSLLGLTLAASFASPTRAAVIAVVDAKGRPAATATVVCVDPASAETVPVSEGRAAVSAECRRVRCDAVGSLPGEADIASAEPKCVLRPAVIVEGDVPATAAGTGLEVRLFAAGNDATPVAKLAVPKAVEGAAASRFAFPPFRPGRYRMEVARVAGDWACGADLGAIGPGRAKVNPAWREPARVAVKVKGSDGKPSPNIAIRTWAGRPPAVIAAENETTTGAWTCAATAVAPTVTDAAGSVRLLVDPSRDALIVAGDWKDPRGLAFATFDRVPSEALALTLALPVRVRGKVVDDKDRPVSCDALLDDLPADLKWLARALSGASTRTTCDPQGMIALGPLPSAALTVELRFRTALPMRIAVDPPAPGATADLGVLRVRNGESIRVVVRDDADQPVRGAKVTARGSSGTVLTVEGTTAEDGGVDLSGFPKHALVAVEVEAAGYMKGEQKGLELADSPFTVKLSPGAAIAGTVRDGGGDGIAGARLYLGNDTNARLRNADSGEGGTFNFEGVEDGAWRLTASAKGFQTSDPISVEIREHRAAERVNFTLEPADGISGRVVDGVGSPIAGALVRLIGAWQRDDLDRASPEAEATSSSDGRYALSAEARSDGWLVATKSGYAPAAERAPRDGAQHGEVVLTLGEPASLIVHLPAGARTSRTLTVHDGAGIGCSVAIAGRSEIVFADLAPGRGTASVAAGADRAVTLVAGQTAEVSLDAAAAIDGRVTFEGAPCPRTRVTAVGEVDSGSLREGAGAFTDERGRYRIEGLAAGPYRVVAIGEDGRAETRVDLTEGENARLDLVVRSVRLIVIVTDGADAKPVELANAFVTPAGAKCSSMMGTSSWGDPGEMGFELAVGSGGCMASPTDSAGVARLTLASPGTYDLGVSDSSFEAWTQSIALSDGTTTKRVSLTRKPDKTGPKSHVVANLRTDPPGMSGTIACMSGNNTSSSSPVSGRYDCGEMPTGPGVIVFHVDGYGHGRTAIDVPETGELVVDVVVLRGGTLVVPVTAGSTAQPGLVDASGTAWSGSSSRWSLDAVIEELPNVGRAWVFRDVPPGMYVATVDGKPRSAVPLASGGTAIAY
jgi:hypothetical protein